MLLGNRLRHRTHRVLSRWTAKSFAGRPHLSRPRWVRQADAIGRGCSGGHPALVIGFAPGAWRGRAARAPPPHGRPRPASADTEQPGGTGPGGEPQSGMRQAGSSSGAYVVDLDDGSDPVRPQRQHRPAAGVGGEAVHHDHRPAALRRQRHADDDRPRRRAVQGHAYVGTLYLRGGGDPTFGAASFNASDTGATIQQLASNLVASTGMTAFRGSIIADESVLRLATAAPPPPTTSRRRTWRASSAAWRSTAAGTTCRAPCSDTHPALVAGA